MSKTIKVVDKSVKRNKLIVLAKKGNAFFVEFRKETLRYNDGVIAVQKKGENRFSKYYRVHPSVGENKDIMVATRMGECEQNEFFIYASGENDRPEEVDKIFCFLYDEDGSALIYGTSNSYTSGIRFILAGEDFAEEVKTEALNVAGLSDKDLYYITERVTTSEHIENTDYSYSLYEIGNRI